MKKDKFLKRIRFLITHSNINQKEQEIEAYEN